MPIKNKEINQMEMDEKYMHAYNEFCDPGAQYRAKPFWAWNERLEEDEIRRQINVFKDMGFGGYFMHSRVGLKTWYLSDEWFKMIAAGIDEGRKTGMEAWLYDEDRWPSGLAGGLVTKDPRFRQKRLNCLRLNAASIPDGTLAVFRASMDQSGCLNSYERINPKDVDENEEVLAFQQVEGYFWSFFNGYTYLDTLSKDAVRAFLDITYEPYAKHCGDEFGKTVPGIFIDEPSRGHFLGMWRPSEHDYQIPWTHNMAEEFKTRMGYDLIDRLPEVFFNLSGECYSKTRADILECINQLYVEAFAEQVGLWCAEHNLILTGHILQENTLGAQVATSGSLARFYEHMQAPGMDILRQIVCHIVPKQVQSVIRQCDKKWALSEMYASHDWDYPLEAFKTYGDWQAVLGINLRCPHLSMYTMAGLRKRDCPPSISFQQPWRNDYKFVEDYFGRLSTFTMQGSPVCDLLFIHPVETLYGMVKPGWAKGSGAKDKTDIKVLENAFDNISNWLFGMQLDFDYGDEDMLSRMSRVQETDDGPEIVVGKMHYRRVLVPPMTNMRSSTLKLLRSFAEKEGEIAWFGEVPAYVDWQSSEEPQQLAKKSVCLPVEKTAVYEHYYLSRVVSVCRADGTNIDSVFAHYKENGGIAWLMLANIDTGLKINDALVRLSFDGQVQEWDPVTTKRSIVSSKTFGGKTEFKTSFVPGGTRLFVITRYADNSLPMQIKQDEVTRIVAQETEFKVSLDEPNVVVLDYPKFKIGDDTWQEAKQILEIDDLVRDYLGLERRSNRVIQPWFKEQFLTKAGEVIPSVYLALKYDFNISVLPEEDIEIVVEQPERSRIIINGQDIPINTSDGWWVDPCLKKSPLPSALLKVGKNEVVLETQFDEHSDLEAIFLLGGFGVRVNGCEVFMEQPVKTLKLGDWTKQGLPFYCGSVQYETSFTIQEDIEAHLVVPGFKGGCVRVYKGGEKIGNIIWKPYEIELPSYIYNNKTNKSLQIEVVGHLGNAHGTIHPDHSPEYMLKPIGLMELPYLSIRKNE